MKVLCACGASLVEPGPIALWEFLRAHRNAPINPKPGVRYKWSAHAIEFDLARGEQ